MWASFVDRLQSQADGASLAVVRWVTAGTLLTVAVGILLSGRVPDLFMQPGVRFYYPLAPFVRPLSGNLPYAHLTVIVGAAIAVLLGWRTKICAVTLCAGTVYWFLLDPLMYSDDFYLITLMTVLLAWVPVNRWMSADRRLGRETRDTVFGWHVWLIRTQLLFVYFFSGVAMLNGDWLSGAPLMERFTSANGSLLANFGTQMPLVIAWLVALFNLSIGFLLAWNRTRTSALVAMTLFHAVDFFWLKVGIAPLLMWAYSFVFCDPNWPRRIFERIEPGLRRLPAVSAIGALLCCAGMLVESSLSWFDNSSAFKKRSPAKKPAAARRAGPKQETLHSSSSISEAGLYCVAAWMLIQVLLPLRGFAYSGSPGWTDEGRIFAWRGRTSDKMAQLTLSVLQTDRELLWSLEPRDEFPLPLRIIYSQEEMDRRKLNDGILQDVTLTEDDDVLSRRIEASHLKKEDVERLNGAFRVLAQLQLSEFQFQEMAKQPELIRQYCVFAAEILQPILRHRPEVQAELLVSLNHRNWAPCIDEGTELSTQRFSLAPNRWILALNEELPNAEQRISFRQAHRGTEIAGSFESAPAGDGPKPSEPVLVPAFTEADEEWLRTAFPETGEDAGEESESEK